MKIKLASDFRDYYDHVFYPEGDVIFDRMAHDRRMPKQEQFEILRSAGLRVPPYWPVDSMLANARYSDDDLVVVYTDEYLHCGEGKELMGYDLAANTYKYAGMYCTPWYNSTGSFTESTSHRYLQIGDLAFWLRYEGKGGWMSNHAEDTEIFIEGWCDRLPAFSEYPMCAIDFVIPVDRPYPTDFSEVLAEGIAIDFNTAPGLRWTGLEDFVSPIDVYDLLCDWFSQGLGQQKPF